MNRGLLYTGDIAKIEENGYIYLKGRKKRFIKILAKRVSLDEIERLLKSKYPEQEFACDGIDEKLEIYFLSNEDNDLKEQLRIFLDKGMGIPDKFVEYYPVSFIPRNESGKLQYSILRGMKE